MAMKLSSRQQEILDFIRERIRYEGLPPTRAEINAHFGFSSPNAAQSHLRALEKKGAITINPGLARGVMPADFDGSSTPGNGLPIIGRVAAGSPLLAIENHESTVHLDAALFHPRPHYLLRVRGESMKDAGISDGDLLAVHRTREAAHGQIVVARINDEVTVKRLRRRGRGIWLDPENRRFKPIQVSSGDDFAIEGLAVGVLRDL